MKICDDSSKCISFEIFDTNNINFNDIKLLKDDKFDFNYINRQYNSLFEKIRNSKNDLYLLKKCYISEPIYLSKEKVAISNDTWYFRNMYNHYFCFCKGFLCKKDKKFDICKYFFARQTRNLIFVNIIYISVLLKTINIYIKKLIIYLLIFWMKK